MEKIKNREWYLSLNKSKLTPPGYVFGIVWPILYLLSGISFLLTLEVQSVLDFVVHLYFLHLK